MRRFVSVIAILTVSGTAHAGGFSGKVVDIVTRRGIPAVTVTVKSAGGEKVLGQAHTDAEGAYTVKDLPNGGRVRLHCVRDGFQARPTIKFVTLTGETRDPGDVPMVSEDGSASYLRSFAKKFALADEETQTMMRGLWFHLPKANSDIIAQEYAALTGKPASNQRELYAAEAEREQAMLAALAALESSTTQRIAQANTHRMHKD